MRIPQEIGRYTKRLENLFTSIGFSVLGGTAIGVAPDIAKYDPEFGIVSVPVIAAMGILATAIAISEFDEFLNPDLENEP